MNKTLKRILIGVGILAVVLFIAFRVLTTMTKKASPEDLVRYVDGDKKIEVFYCQPAKKGREIFGGLIPYGKVWRTGANEASTFETTHALQVGGKKLPAGKYTLWTIPNADHWSIIFNSKMYGWGVNFSEEASRDPQYDIVSVDVPTESTASVTERFTIKVESAPAFGMNLAWDNIKINVPLQWE